jgi:hypothetical protein
MLDASGNFVVGSGSPRSKFDVTGTGGIHWGVGDTSCYGMVTIGDVNSDNSVFVHTPSLTSNWPSGLGINGVFGETGQSASVNLTAYGVCGVGNWGGDLVLRTTRNQTVEEAIRMNMYRKIGVRTGTTINYGFEIAGVADVVQLGVRGNSTQNANLLLLEKSDGTDVFTVNPLGYTTMAGGFLSSGASTVVGNFTMSGNNSLINSMYLGSDTYYYYPYMSFNRSRGTYSSPTDVQANDYLGAFSFYGYNGGFQGAAGFNVQVEALSGSYVKGRLVFAVSDGTTGGANQEAFRCTSASTIFNNGSVDADYQVNSDTVVGALFVQGSDGFVGFGTTAPVTKVQINSSTVAAAAIGTEELLKITRPINTGICYPQAASFALGTWATNSVANGYGPKTRLDLKIKSTSATDFNTTTTAQTWLDNGNVGFGTTAPGYRVDVQGTAATDLINSEIGMNLSFVPNPVGPTAALVNQPGNVNAGVHYYEVTFYTAIGETSAVYTTPNNVTTDASNGQVTIGIPVSSDHRVIGRKIYRSSAGGSQYECRLIATVANNTDLTYTDNTADSGLSGVSCYFRSNTTNKAITYNGNRAVTLDAQLVTLGPSAGANITAGGRDVFIGASSGSGCTTGNDNTFVGNASGSAVQTGGNNTAIGSYAFSNKEGGANTCIGYGTQLSVAGNSNVVIGHLAGYNPATATSVNYNTLIGVYAGQNIATNSQLNTVMGYYAGMAIGGTNGIFLGSYAGRYETAGAKLILDAFDRTNEANQRAQAVIYGVMSSTAANQILSLGGGGKVGINEIAPPTIFNVGAKLVDTFSYTYDTNSTVLVHQTPTAAATLNDPKNVLLLGRQGTSSQCYAAGSAFMLSRYENDGAPNYGSRTRLDISLAHVNCACGKLASIAPVMSVNSSKFARICCEIFIFYSD